MLIIIFFYCALGVLVSASDDIFEPFVRHSGLKEWNMTEALKNGYIKTKGGLNDIDRELVLKYYGQSESVFEFGVGESTTIASALDVPRFTGVDNDPVWINNVRGQSPLRFKFHYADIGPIREWGVPQVGSFLVGKQDEVAPESKQWPRYALEALANEFQPFNFYMVDGRFRVACVCAAMLHASKYGKASSDYLIGLHDYPNRYNGQYSDVWAVTEYVDGHAGEQGGHMHSVAGRTHFLREGGSKSRKEDKRLRMKESVGAQLFVFRRNASVTDKEILALLEKHLYDWR